VGSVPALQYGVAPEQLPSTMHGWQAPVALSQKLFGEEQSESDWQATQVALVPTPAQMGVEPEQAAPVEPQTQTLDPLQMLELPEQTTLAVAPQVQEKPAPSTTQEVALAVLAHSVLAAVVHAHSPAVQVPGVPGQTAPQAPQLAGSVCRFLQVPPQSVWPLGHSHSQVSELNCLPPEQTMHWPVEAQMLPAQTFWLQVFVCELQVTPGWQQMPPQYTRPFGQLQVPVVALQVPVGQQDMLGVAPLPQNSVPAGQTQVALPGVVVVSQVAPEAVGQQTPELEFAAWQTVVPAGQVPQRPEALPWPLSPRQVPPRVLSPQHGLAHSPGPLPFGQVELPWQPPPPAWQDLVTSEGLSPFLRFFFASASRPAASRPTVATAAPPISSFKASRRDLACAKALAIRSNRCPSMVSLSVRSGTVAGKRSPVTPVRLRTGEPGHARRVANPLAAPFPASAGCRPVAPARPPAPRPPVTGWHGAAIGGRL